MQKLCSVVMLVAVLGSFARPSGLAKADDDHALAEEVMKLERDMVPILLKGGSEAAKWWERYNDDHIDYVGADGHMLTKAQLVAEWRSGVRKASSVVHDDYRVRVYGNTVVVTYRGRETGKQTASNRRGRDEANRTTEVWIKREGTWQRIVHHVTPVEKE